MALPQRTMDLLTTLKNNGYKITTPRKEVALLLLDHPKDDHSGPLSIQDISTDLLRKSIAVDVVSIYRTLELFMRLGIVHEVEFGEGMKRYELFSPDEHHHHLVCEICGLVTEITVPLERKILEEVEHITNYQIKRHSLEFFGRCKACTLSNQ